MEMLVYSTAVKIFGTVVRCLWCDKEHVDLIFTPMKAPMLIDGQSYDHVAKCPETGRDIYGQTVINMAIIEE